MQINKDLIKLLYEHDFKLYRDAWCYGYLAFEAHGGYQVMNNEYSVNDIPVYHEGDEDDDWRLLSIDEFKKLLDDQVARSNAYIMRTAYQKTMDAIDQLD